ncbi:MAG: ribosome recycling factor [Parvibaculum sp.]|jgi:ribosome recycling factor|uniref:ribosome recycling factor n=1 Tax=Parvibaculum sp. TaxID=2024848 RepID=UPI000DCB2D53|nr:ribosome recycling factor [Parvibaculum sp.]MDR3500105.1 ribosome recycling factor [Parvibaculum sp.]RAV92653.1 ribosome recycling factor [Aerococcus mictus]
MADPKTLDIADVERRMRGALQALKEEFSGLRTGRASAGILDPVTVDAYGQKMPISQVGTVGVPEPRMITVQVWDRALVSAVDKAIRNAGLGLNPNVDGQLIRLPIPELNQERRTELTKIAAKYTEQARIAVRNVRRDAMDELKRLEKDGHMGQDDHKAGTEKVQKLTDKIIAEIDAALAHKEAEIMQV